MCLWMLVLFYYMVISELLLLKFTSLLFQWPLCIMYYILKYKICIHDDPQVLNIKNKSVLTLLGGVHVCTFSSRNGLVDDKQTIYSRYLQRPKRRRRFFSRFGVTATCQMRKFNNRPIYVALWPFLSGRYLWQSWKSRSSENFISRWYFSEIIQDTLEK